MGTNDGQIPMGCRGEGDKASNWLVHQSFIKFSQITMFILIGDMSSQILQPQCVVTKEKIILPGYVALLLRLELLCLQRSLKRYVHKKNLTHF